MIIHWPSYVLGVATLLIIEIILAIYLLKKLFKNNQDPKEEEKTIDRLTKEYEGNARGSK